MMIIDALHTREIFAPLFKDPRTRHAWEVYLRGLLGLELGRRAKVGGKDLITHYVGGHDDVCNSACGALVAAYHSISRGVVQVISLRDPNAPPAARYKRHGRRLFPGMVIRNNLTLINIGLY